PTLTSEPVGRPAALRRRARTELKVVQTTVVVPLPAITTDGPVSKLDMGPLTCTAGDQEPVGPSYRRAAMLPRRESAQTTSSPPSAAAAARMPLSALSGC